MRVPLHVVEARRERLAALIDRHRYLPVRELCRRLGVSEATARRDLAALESLNKVRRTHGGAIADFNERFPSFNDRQSTSARSKASVAKAALGLMRPGGTYFFDSGTTIFALAEAFREAPVGDVTVVTSNLPVGELLASVPEVGVFQVAGQILGRQSVLVGETACRSMEFWNFDVAFLSAEGVDGDGVWNTQHVITMQQLASIRRAARSVFCIDRAKIGRRAPHLLLPWSGVDLVLTDASDREIADADVPSDKVLRVGEPLQPLGDSAPLEDLPVHFL